MYQNIRMHSKQKFVENIYRRLKIGIVGKIAKK